MDYYLDIAWELIADSLRNGGDMFASLLQHLHFLGPAFLIALLALLTVCITKILSRYIITKRYTALEKEYYHWYAIRQEAMKLPDGDKGRMLARNIDQAELNRVYYDYFFEGLLLGIARRIIPIFFVFSFINEYYNPKELSRIFSREYVMQLGTIGGDPLLLGAPFYFIVMLIVCFAIWPLTGHLFKKLRKTLANNRELQVLKERQGEV